MRILMMIRLVLDTTPIEKIKIRYVDPIILFTISF